MEELFIEIYTKKKIKYCGGCLHTDDDTKLYSMQNYTWIFTSLFTNLCLSDELQSSWICSWCIRRLNNANNLLKNFQQAQVLLSKIAGGISCETVEETNNDIFHEINELKFKSRLNFCSDLDNCNLNKNLKIENDLEVKSEISEGNVSCEENDIDEELEFSDSNNPNKSSNEEIVNDNFSDSNPIKGRLRRVNTKRSCKYDNIRRSKRIEKLTKIESISENHSVDSEIEFDNLNTTDISQMDNNYMENEMSDSENRIEIPTPDLVSSDLINESPQIHCFTSDTDKIVMETKITNKVKPEAFKNFKSNVRFKNKNKKKKRGPYLAHSPRRQCPECDCLFIKEIALLNHLKRMHKKKYPCEQCDKIYWNEEYLKTHIAKVHEARIGEFECAVCGRIFKHRLNIVKHLMRHEKYGNTLREIENIVCHHCGKICTRKNITSHLLIHSNIKNYHCSSCSASFKIAGTLENHIKRKHKDPRLSKIFACELCGRKFYDPTQVKYHMISIHSFQGHACPLCSKCFPTPGKVREHVRRVHEKVPAVRDKQCDFCEKVFSTKRMLRHHRYTHTGEKPYKCDLCSSAYNQSHCLKMHKERAHSTEKPKTKVG